MELGKPPGLPLLWGLRPEATPQGAGMEESERDFLDALRRALTLHLEVRPRDSVKEPAYKTSIWTPYVQTSQAVSQARRVG
jgi:hypothetical protein